VGDILSKMLEMGGADAHAGAILQQAATAMHSDTQLKQDEPRHRSFVIDQAVAESWYVKGFYDNALEKHRQALRDVEDTAFPTEEEKDLAIAGVYKSVGKTLERLGQYTDMIAYEEAAIALGGRTDDEYYICYGYNHLKDYDSAVRTCTKALDETGSMKARFWRGASYRDSGQADAALGDLTIVADSEDDFRTTAAIDLSMIYFDRHDDRSALSVLNKYTYLYDPKTDDKNNIAVSYNNRCYAYMQLGQLKEALSDCKASLQYGSLPDAYRKQQELVKRLAAGETGL
jgi:tetratricopeptide (TPR) repeat protein